MEYECAQWEREEELEQVGPGYFAIQHIYWSVLLYFFFMARLFGRLRLPGAAEPLSAAASQRILLALVAICAAVGLEHDRRQWRLALNVLTPYGLYLVLKGADQNPVYLWAVVLICLGASLVYAAVLFSAPVHDQKNRSFVMEMRFYQLISVAWLLLRAMLSLLAAVFMVGALLGFTLAKPAREGTRAEGAEIPGDVEPWSGQLQGLEEERWAGLTLQEKTELMQLVADIETDYLGLPDTLQVHCLGMRPPTLGFYNHEVRAVCISQDHMLYDPPEECLDTVLHEVYHSYQRHLCAVYEETGGAYRSMLFFRRIGNYIDEFEHYNRGEEDFMDYYTQTCETDAREYAWARSHEYQYVLSSAEEGE